MSAKKKILITFLGNINYDSRCNNFFETLNSQNFDAQFIGFDWLTENFISLKGTKSVYKLSKKKSSLFFYLKFYILLSQKVLTTKFDFIFAEDVYCLPVCVLAAKIKRAKVIYDCRELYGFLAGLRNRSLIQKLWRIVENSFISKADLILTTGEMDSDFIKSNYGIKNNLLLIRNLPLFKKSSTPVNYYKLLNIENSKKILLYQGVILSGRGIDIVFKLLESTDEFVFVIVGGGEKLDYYKKLSEEMHLNKKVYFVGKISQNKIIDYTSGAFAGLSLIENVSLSYYYALPNKMFEYIMAEIPIITTNLPQMKKIIDQYKVGFSVQENDIEQLRNVLSKLLNDQRLYSELKTNCNKAAEELNWENEIKEFLQII